MAGMDIMHPLSTLQWEECGPWPGGMALNQAVLLGNKVYIGATVREQIAKDPGPVFQSMGKVYCSTTDLKSWTPISVPDVKRFSLCTYRSQLILAGGLLRSQGKAGYPSTVSVVNTIWVSDDDRNWQANLVPPMPLPCREPTIVNVGNPEYLFILGGYDRDFKAVDRVCVLIDEQWTSVQRLPQPCRLMKATVHKGSLYLTGRGNGMNCCTVYCKLESLTASCNLVRTGELDRTTTPWKTLDWPPKPVYNPVSFGSRLITSKRTFVLGAGMNEFYAYCPFTQSWVLVGEVLNNLRLITTLVLPTGELMIIGRCYRPRVISRGYKVYKATVKMSPYSPDSRFSMCALSKLEAVGIQAVTILAEIHRQIAATAKFSTDLNDHPRLGKSTPIDCLKIILNLWLTGKSPLPPTWRSLYKVLVELGLEELSEQIEECLASVDSLKEISTSVIMSALLEQESLEPDQLPVKLPDYVPPTVKRYITHTFMTDTLQLPPPTPSPSPSPPPSKKVCTDAEGSHSQLNNTGAVAD